MKQLDNANLSPISRMDGVVALVDDDPHISNALEMCFRMHGFSTARYISAESLLQAVRHENGCLYIHVDADRAALPLMGAVIDLNLPGITGFELARSLRGLMPDLPIATMTALREDERLRYGNPPQGICCLRKPFDIEALEDALFPLWRRTG